VGRAGTELIPAGARDIHFVVGGVDSGFHERNEDLSEFFTIT
jgi:hypothetical protein